VAGVRKVNDIWRVPIHRSRNFRLIPSLQRGFFFERKKKSLASIASHNDTATIMRLKGEDACQNRTPFFEKYNQKFAVACTIKLHDI